MSSRFSQVQLEFSDDLKTAGHMANRANSNERACLLYRQSTRELLMGDEEQLGAVAGGR
jgi:hypothetical protein